MTPYDCPWTKRVEEARDARLPARDAELFLAHLHGCEACANETGKLDTLARTLRALADAPRGPQPVADARQKLLADARALQASGRSERHSTRWMAVAAAAALVLAAGGSLWYGVAPLRSSSTLAGSVPATAMPGQARAASRADGIEVRLLKTAGASFTRTQTAVGETVLLRDGELGFEVRRRGPEQRFLVVLPDGTLEDVGTDFRVHVADGRTREVSVTAGKVVLRLAGEPERTLSAGERFVATSVVTPTDQGPGPSTLPAVSAAPNAVRGTLVPKLAPDEGAPGGGHDCAGIGNLEQGVASFHDGSYAAAARSLESFLGQCPGSKQAEDASYLRMVALARAGRSAEASAAAKDYLSRFRSGFRRKEAQRIAGPQ